MIAPARMIPLLVTGFASFSASLWQFALILLHAPDRPVWIQLPMSVCLSLAMCCTYVMPKEKRLPVRACLIAALAAGLIWPVMMFVRNAQGLAFLWQTVCTALTFFALVEAEKLCSIGRMFLLFACGIGVILCAGSYALASGIHVGFIPH